MTIYTPAEFAAWEAHTIGTNSVSAVQLLERAAQAAAEWIHQQAYSAREIVVICGPGNNGADGLAIARLLQQTGEQVQVLRLPSLQYSSLHLHQLALLANLPIPITVLAEDEALPTISEEQLVIDALFGIGLNRPLSGFADKLVQHLNRQPGFTISIDMPTGLPANLPLQGAAIMAQVTLTFQSPKLALFMAENDTYCGHWRVLDIGLSADFVPPTPAVTGWVKSNSPLVRVKTYRRHANKTLLGHALVSAGSTEKLGAAVLCAAAALRSGCGLVTVSVPTDGFTTLQGAVPEAMCVPQTEAWDDHFAKAAKIGAAGIGPGWGTSEAQANLLEDTIVKAKVPLLIDATGLYHLAANLNVLALRPPDAITIITPHTGEFARLFGPTANGFDRLKLAVEMARFYDLFIVLKGAFTQVITPWGQCYFNSSGNPGMAKAGSGDVLTGIITGLLAQRYSAEAACVLGVYAHGLAGDIAAQKFSPQGMKAMDIVNSLPKAWKRLTK